MMEHSERRKPGDLCLMEQKDISHHFPRADTTRKHTLCEEDVQDSNSPFLLYQQIPISSSFTCLCLPSPDKLASYLPSSVSSLCLCSLRLSFACFLRSPVGGIWSANIPPGQTLHPCRSLR